jgi:hypothetical protein
MQDIIPGSWPAPEPRFDATGRDVPNPSDAGAGPDRLFTGALFSDMAYWKTAEMMWADFSAWLLFAGLVQSLSCCLPGGSAGRWCTGTVWELRHDT